jgi:hypothetical protein
VLPATEFDAVLAKQPFELLAVTILFSRQPQAIDGRQRLLGGEVVYLKRLQDRRLELGLM